MADEAELIKVAFQGTEMFLRLGGVAVKDALKFLKFLVCIIPNIYRWNQETLEKHYRKQMTKAEWEEILRQKMELEKGEVPLQDLMNKHKNSELTLLSIPDSSSERFAELAKKHKLNYSLLPDLNVADGVFQVMVPAVQADLYNAVLQTLTEEEKRDRETMEAFLEEEIRRTEEERMQSNTERKQMEKDGTDQSDPDHYKEVCGTIEACNRRKSELEKELGELQGRESREITYEDYMNTNKQVMDHMDLFSDLKEKGVELSGAEKISEFVKMPGKDETIDSKLPQQQNMKLKPITYEEAVKKLTARKEIKEPVIACDRDSPENYMEVTAKQEKEEDRTYINTEFKVFRNGEEQRCEEFSHGKFTHYSDRNANNSSEAGEQHWENMKKEMKEKGGLSDNLLLFPSREDYQKFLEEADRKQEHNRILGDQYLTNPAVPDMAIRRDKVPDEAGKVTAYRYTVLINGKDTNIQADMDYHTADETKTIFLKHVNEEAKRLFPEADAKEAWMVFDTKEDFEIYQDSVKKNVRSDKENLKEEFGEAFEKEGVNLKKQMNRESRVQAEQEKKQTILKVPSQSILSLKRDKKGNPADDVLLYSADLSYSIKIGKKDARKIKKDMDGTSLILLEEGEALTVTDRYSKREIGTITSQNELSDFLENKGKYPAKQGSIPLQKQKGGEKHAAKTQKHSN